MCLPSPSARVVPPVNSKVPKHLQVSRMRNQSGGQAEMEEDNTNFEE